MTEQRFGDGDMADGVRDKERSDEQYAKALRALQSGDWANAIQELEELSQQEPVEERVQKLLEEARFKARLGGDTAVKARQLTIPWGRISIVVLTIALLGVGGWYGYRYIKDQVIPAVAQAQSEDNLRTMLEEAKDFYSAGDWEQAEGAFTVYLELDPGNAEALAALDEIAQRREIESLYSTAVSLQAEGSFVEALAAFTELSVISPGYRDVDAQISTISQDVELFELYREAGLAFEGGDTSSAVGLYEQVRMTDLGYEQAIVESRLFELYSRLGLELITRDPFSVADVPAALDYFGNALAIKPRDTAIVREKTLASSFLTAWSYYESGDWGNAYRQLEAVQQQSPGYGGTVLRNALYESYVNAGDQAEARGDIYLAYELYRRATQVMGVEVSYAVGRMTQLRPFITPSPTPSATPIPTSTPIPVPAGYVPAPTRAPTPKPIESYRGQIVFTGTFEDRTGYWVVNPDGTGLQYLGAWRSLISDVEAQETAATFSPDGKYQLFVRDVANIAQVFMTQPFHEQYGEVPPLQITRLGVCYDPVWSPDGGRIAFVSEETGSDDIWVIRTDGTGGVNLTENSWPWDKHPSWSPDSRQITFWSNRSGTSQIYVMDVDGSNLVMITEFDEAVDPVWIK